MKSKNIFGKILAKIGVKTQMGYSFNTVTH